MLFKSNNDYSRGISREIIDAHKKEYQELFAVEGRSRKDNNRLRIIELRIKYMEAKLLMPSRLSMPTTGS